LNYTYIDSISKFALPGIAPNISANLAGDYAKLYDGLLLTGGGDIDPAYYGETPHPKTEIVHPAYDKSDRALFAGFFEAKKPIFGICRGLQVINVCLGGSLVQDIPDASGSRIHSRPGQYIPHIVTPVPGSFIHTISPKIETVNSSHHQAVDRPGRGLMVAARAEDGVIEALESQDGLVSGVQWHPERFPYPMSTALFERFCRLCG
jgi:putative glutamine amidotransferase